ncbi:MAG: MFS transporter [Ornithinimicrobium sp.]
MAPRWWTLIAVCTGIFVLLLDITIVTVALPDIQRELDASLSDLQWVIDAYALVLASLLLTAGSLADLYGRKLVFVIGIALFGLGSALCGLAPNVLSLTLARGAQGIGGAAMFATALALLAATFSGRERGVAFGAFGAVTGVAVAVGPVVGGVLTSGLSWRWIFWVNLPICLAAIIVSLRTVQESKDPDAGAPDWVGFVTFSSALGLLVFGLIDAGLRGWTDDLVIGALSGSAVLLALFVVSQAKQSKPMFDLALLRKPTFVGGLIAAFAVSGSIFSLLTYLVIYVQNVLGYSAIETGVRLLFLSVMSLFSATAAGRLTSRVPTKWLIAPGFALLGVGLSLLLLIGDDTSWLMLIPGLMVCGLATGMINVPLASTAVGVVATSRAGMASGANSTFRQVGIATGIAALGSIFSRIITTDITADLAATPAAAQADQIAAAVTGGQIERVVSMAPASSRDLLEQVATTGFVDALNQITLIAAATAFVASVFCLALIRQRDFVS